MFNIGDKVAILRPIKTGEFGWTEEWKYDDYLNKALVVDSYHINDIVRLKIAMQYRNDYILLPERILEKVYEPEFKKGDDVEYYVTGTQKWKKSKIDYIFPLHYKLSDGYLCRHIFCLPVLKRWILGCSHFQWTDDFKVFKGVVDGKEVKIRRDTLEALYDQINSIDLCPTSWVIAGLLIVYSKETGNFYYNGDPLGTSQDLAGILKED